MIERFDRVLVIIIGRLKRRYRIEEQSQRLGCFHAGIHVALLLTVVGLGKEPADQLDEQPQ